MWRGIPISDFRRAQIRCKNFKRHFIQRVRCFCMVAFLRLGARYSCLKGAKLKDACGKVGRIAGLTTWLGACWACFYMHIGIIYLFISLYLPGSISDMWPVPLVRAWSFRMKIAFFMTESEANFSPCILLHDYKILDKLYFL